VLLSLLGFRSDYRAERELWRINRTLSYVASHQESTPDYAINQLADRYRAFIKKYSKSIHARQAQIMLGDLYALRKNYDQARLEYQKAVGPDKELSAQAEFTMARTYELQGQGSKALAIYKSIIQNYPVTNSGFLVPMYLTRHLVVSEDEAYDNALAFYKKIVLKYPKSKLEYDALRMIAICQLNQKDWSGAVDTMGEVILKYPIGTALKDSITAINILCVTKLHDYNKAINIYRKFIQKYPDHLADPLLKKMIQDLQLLKNKNLIIKTKPPVTAKK
jgi:TolA-binding protein